LAVDILKKEEEDALEKERLEAADKAEKMRVEREN